MNKFVSVVADIVGIVVALLIVVAILIRPTSLWVIVAELVAASLILTLIWFVRHPGPSTAPRARRRTVGTLVAFILLLLVVPFSLMFTTVKNDSAGPAQQTVVAMITSQVTLVESDDDHYWELFTRVTLSPSNIDRILETAGYPSQKKFAELDATERDAALAVVYQQLAANGMTPERDTGESITATKTTRQEIDSFALWPPRLAISSTLSLPSLSLGEIGLEPDANSVMTLETKCRAFIEVTPAGDHTCTGEDEVRTIKLADAAGRSQSVQVKGRVIYPKLRFTAFQWFLTISLDSVLAWLLLPIGAGITALFSEQVKNLLKGIWKKVFGSKDDKKDKDGGVDAPV